MHNLISQTQTDKATVSMDKAARQQKHLFFCCENSHVLVPGRGLQLFLQGSLPVCTDGRMSAGPLDLSVFLAQVCTTALHCTALLC